MKGLLPTLWWKVRHRATEQKTTGFKPATSNNLPCDKTSLISKGGRERREGRGGRGEGGREED